MLEGPVAEYWQEKRLFIGRGRGEDISTAVPDMRLCGVTACNSHESVLSLFTAQSASTSSPLVLYGGVAVAACYG